MCGIFFAQSRQGPCEPDEATLASLKARGPDSIRTLHVTLPSLSNDDPRPVSLTFCSSVLALRGDRVQRQPLVDSATGSVLCWNGEAWRIGSQQIDGNDSVQVFELLISAAAEKSYAPKIIEEVLETISGPFAFVFYDGLHSVVYFGRDRLGRRSLVMGQDASDTLIVSSISTSFIPSECSTDGVYCLSPGQSVGPKSPYPWTSRAPTINRSLPGMLIEPVPTTQAVTALIEQLTRALKPRIQNIPIHNELQMFQRSARLAILFSGGLDCTLVARICHDILPQSESIDLINVAFENPRSASATSKLHSSPFEACPDRVTGRASFEELTRTCPCRPWRFVAVDVPYAEVLAHRTMIIHLMRPHDTEMDLSIAMALYFAARGQTLASASSTSDARTQLFGTTARVLLSGLGADELFAGYSRHASAFARAGYNGLIDELELDFRRIGNRNLGRDDRVLSHWGREVRYPYLDEDFVNYALGLPVWEKCGFRPGRAVPKHYEEMPKAEREVELDPAKMLLRLAAWELEMNSVAGERKRAIQFGARTAKMEQGGGRKKGTDKLFM